MNTSLPEPIKNIRNKALSKAGEKFIDFVIQRFTGKSIKVFEAEGDIEADKIRTRWEAIEKPLWIEMEKRKVYREYTNLENTLLIASKSINSNTNKITDENDVFWGMIEHSKQISDEAMQELVAKIIAGEFNEPGTYSMATLQTIKMLGRKELLLFEKINSLTINNTQIPFLLFSGNNNASEIMESLNLDFGNLQVLQSLGLIHPNEMTRSISTKPEQGIKIKYFDKVLFFTPVEIQAQIVKLPGFYQLSPTGVQLVQHLHPAFLDNYWKWLEKNYRIPKFRLQK